MVYAFTNDYAYSFFFSKDFILAISLLCLSQVINGFSCFGSLVKDGQEFDFKLMPLIPYSPSSLDYKNSLKGPFDNQILSHWSKRHWLGTDDLGRDIFSGMIHGLVMFFNWFGAMFIAF